MRIITKRRLREFWLAHPAAEQALKAWFEDAESATWRTPNNIKRTYRNASIVGSERVVFNIHGNHFRLVIAVDYEESVILIKWIGTHRDHDTVDVETIGR